MKFGTSYFLTMNLFCSLFFFLAQIFEPTNKDVQYIYAFLGILSGGAFLYMRYMDRKHEKLLRQIDRLKDIQNRTEKLTSQFLNKPPASTAEQILANFDEYDKEFNKLVQEFRDIERAQ